MKGPHDSVVEAMLKMLADLVNTDLSSEIAIMRNLAGGFAKLSKVTSEWRHKSGEQSAVPCDIISKIRGTTSIPFLINLHMSRLLCLFA